MVQTLADKFVRRVAGIVPVGRLRVNGAVVRVDVGVWRGAADHLGDETRAERSQAGEDEPPV